MNADTSDRAGGLLGWQWANYSPGHRDLRNLVIHALTVPLFLAGTCAVLATPVVGPLGLIGLAGMAIAVGAQGRGHAREPARPLPFRGPADVAARLFVEQWVTFPRFVLSGGFARAWRQGR